MAKREPMLLMAGGVCRPDAGECKKSDLLKLDIDFAIFQNLIAREFLGKTDSTIIDPESNSDILIIQLPQSVSPGWLKENKIDIVCLPLHKQVPPPEKFAVVGWGKNSLDKDANPSSICGESVNWAPNLISDDNDVLCGATYVTPRHLITIPDCIIPALKAAQRKAGYVPNKKCNSPQNHNYEREQRIYDIRVAVKTDFH
ncbi:hypothetical protein DdX_09638 [Ditylenchus destructor]|uniref:Peptidase S1 domain-containing protein n=1 Tax=Ditylenchus destructor TaxID=166010 RepID=A0AAD4MZK5_9BILA|nr:hypothetical protein DdX_09638 [Ditylenchus destructor]